MKENIIPKEFIKELNKLIQKFPNLKFSHKYDKCNYHLIIKPNEKYFIEQELINDNMKEDKEITPEEFLERVLKFLVKKFPKMKVSYGFFEQLNKYIVVVDPDIIYNESKAYSRYQTIIYFKFIEQFHFNKEIFFCSNEEYKRICTIFVKINSLYAIKGKLYDE